MVVEALSCGLAELRELLFYVRLGMQGSGVRVLHARLEPTRMSAAQTHAWSVERAPTALT